MTLEVTRDGNIRCLYTDEVNLSQLGQLSVSRASYIEFDNHLRKWTVTSVKTGKKLHSAFSRENTLDWECKYYSPKGEGWDELTLTKDKGNV